MAPELVFIGDLALGTGTWAERVALHLTSMATFTGRPAGAKFPYALVGEPGTGKEMIARAVHRLSPVCGGPFEALSVGAIPTDRLPAELQGEERGPSEHTTIHPGVFERASRGTVFLDGAEALTHEAQGHLRRIIDTEGAVERRGCDLNPIPTDVRHLFFALREEPASLVRRGILNGLTTARFCCTLWIPPLRSRRWDVLPLARHFARREGRELSLTPRARQRLLAHTWPGNVRELEQVIREALRATPSGPVDLDAVRHLSRREPVLKPRAIPQSEGKPTYS